MKLLRSLISLEIEDSKDESSELHETEQYQSAKELIRPKQLLHSNKPSKFFAYSSMHLVKHTKKVLNDNMQHGQKQKHEQEHKHAQKHEQEQEQQQQQQQKEIYLDLPSGANQSFTRISNINLTLPSNYDLNAIDEKIGHASSISMSCCTSNKDLTLSDSSLNDTNYTLSDNETETNIDSITHHTSTAENDEIFEDVQLNIFPANDFKFMYNIGHGAFGIVHKEFHLKSCQIVAIKQCRSTNSESIKSFKKEIKICSEFKDCPYIINMIEYGLIQKENKICVALEYMNMSSLNKNKYVFNKNTISRITSVCLCILRALNCLHSKAPPYIHNDVKPDNILFNVINNHWEIVLSDFGCIKQMKDINIPLTKPIGTEFYQSYEKRFISPIEYNTKTDIYSFGITICELLLQKEQLNKDIIIPFEIPKEIMTKYSKTNGDLIDFLNKCLHRNYNKRWNAKQLLNHPFLVKNKSKNGISNCNNQYESEEKDFDDLEFMINTLIDYYSHYEYQISSTNNKNNNMSMISTPIDNIWTDSDRIQNIAKSSGYSVEYVNDFISQKVTSAKNKYLKK